MRLCRSLISRIASIKSITRENNMILCALLIWVLSLVLTAAVIYYSLNNNSINKRNRSITNSNYLDMNLVTDKLQKHPEAREKRTRQVKWIKKEVENPAVITRSLYKAGHKMPLNDVCPKQGEGMKLMILVMSSPGHVSQRSTIRSTWGSVAFRRDIGLAFMLGLSNQSLNNEQIERENHFYGDIIQGMFIDTYNNLTLKTISALEWSWTYCSLVKYLLKTDDDVYIHTPVLLGILDEVVDRRRTIMGFLAKGWRPVRDMKSHYYISKSQFQNNKFPNFHTGPAYVLTSDIVKQLYQAALNVTFFKLEDVFITGMIANNESNIEHRHYPQFLNARPKKILDTCSIGKLAAVHELRKEEMFDLWKRLSTSGSYC